MQSRIPTANDRFYNPVNSRPVIPASPVRPVQRPTSMAVTAFGAKHRPIPSSLQKVLTFWRDSHVHSLYHHTSTPPYITTDNRIMPTLNQDDLTELKRKTGLSEARIEDWFRENPISSTTEIMRTEISRDKTLRKEEHGLMEKRQRIIELVKAESPDLVPNNLAQEKSAHPIAKSDNYRFPSLPSPISRFNPTLQQQSNEIDKRQSGIQHQEEQTGESRERFEGYGIRRVSNGNLKRKREYEFQPTTSSFDFSDRRRTSLDIRTQSNIKRMRQLDLQDSYGVTNPDPGTQPSLDVHDGAEKRWEGGWESHFKVTENVNVEGWTDQGRVIRWVDEHAMRRRPSFQADMLQLNSHRLERWTHWNSNDGESRESTRYKTRRLDPLDAPPLNPLEIPEFGPVDSRGHVTHWRHQVEPEDLEGLALNSDSRLSPTKTPREWKGKPPGTLPTHNLAPIPGQQFHTQHNLPLHFETDLWKRRGSLPSGVLHRSRQLGDHYNMYEGRGNDLKNVSPRSSRLSREVTRRQEVVQRETVPKSLHVASSSGKKHHLTHKRPSDDILSVDTVLTPWEEEEKKPIVVHQQVWMDNTPQISNIEKEREKTTDRMSQLHIQIKQETREGLDSQGSSVEKKYGEGVSGTKSPLLVKVKQEVKEEPMDGLLSKMEEEI